MNLQTVTAIFVLLIVAVIMSAQGIYARQTVEYHTATVTDKDRIVETSSDGEGNTTTSSKYLVFTEDTTYELTDSLWHWQWNSSDMYGKISRGTTYCFKTYGWRSGFFSMYENIVSIEPGRCES